MHQDNRCEMGRRTRRNKGETAVWVANDLPLEVFKQSLDELALRGSISALGGNELQER